MAAINFGGLATGLDTNSIIDGLMEIYRQPLDRLESNKNLQTQKLNAFKAYEDVLKEFRDAVRDMSLTSDVQLARIDQSDSGYVKAEATSAKPGSYDIKVAQTAQVQKSASVGFASNTENLGAGTLSLEIGAKTVEFSFTEDGSSLEDIADALNAKSSETGVSATVINDGSGDTPYRLLLSGADAGVAFATGGELGTVLDSTTTQEARKAVAYVDGVRVQSDTNTLTGVIRGVTLNFLKESARLSEGVPEIGVEPHNWAEPPQWEATSINISQDVDGLKEKMRNFVEIYNKVMEFVQPSEVPETADENEEAEEEDLSWYHIRQEPAARSTMRRLQRYLTQQVDTGGNYNSLSSLGLSTNRDGTIQFDEARFEKAASEDFLSVTTILAGNDQEIGVMKPLKDYLYEVTNNYDGFYAGRKETYDLKMDGLDKQIERTTWRLEQREVGLRAQFTALEQLVSGMNQTTQYLEQYINQLSWNRD